MGLSGVLHVEVEVKSPAEKFWVALGDGINLFPKAFPNDYKTIQVLAGDGNAPGSIRLITYGEGSPLVKISAERIEAVDLENKSMSYSIIGGEMLEYYKTFKGTITVIPKDGGSLLKWSGEFEKTAHEIDDPHVIKDFAVKNFKEIDEYLLKQTSA
ncbi:Bet v I/Major latex protein [Arabidopsis suecica]|jgi:hypothetical protein|uniref:MLP-like protein 423 n=2 Tax=Arabidopsis TaxID=3701 RepID=ML423_ARATH|nr:MLP-like protein 423 [Arabidopsis thaliana]NP_173813.1 MLP-like protein 423 [Arabidopsis thaliana]Q93VR4.1 RecName: Full=MLP-like protein 423 [Arabidopsis thaliana]KAG7655357.1 Bet v I/Major latex protein [Arabidopsis suecica]AAK96470.1 At1g24020/T23E23_22 [Arabidopsis thaliana]AAL31239.1 At1g24020/T23E23_22 [Arabidopsis thaliana]AEE30466.1 MLP-like protein 423 [Arabidopsis thaliana]AEE30467.1 MLP-like protein 423 [Arabidopsis thaliana]|eukprot:NP_001185075.1 MLP-like protein 423 [Arabidopsis thaliana]